jgi:hypothetical protein
VLAAIFWYLLAFIASWLSFIPADRNVSPFDLWISNLFVLLVAVFSYVMGLNETINMIIKPFLPENYTMRNWKEE